MPKEKKERTPVDPAVNFTRKFISSFIHSKKLDLLDLNPREQDIITLRWAYGLTLEQIAQNQGLGKERTRQVYSTAIAKFFIRLNHLISKYPDQEKLQEENEKLRQQIELYKDKFEFLSMEEKKELEGPDIRFAKIETIDFSVRVFNSLRTAKIYTVNDLLKHSKVSLLSQRGFGIKVLKEIEQFMQEHQLVFKDKR